LLLKGERAVNIVINGESRPFAAGATVLSLLRTLGLTESRVAVERNKALVRKAEYADTRLTEGDRIEIVTFVGGG
jgi:thiamine biosynthesis protein ThiS